MNRIVELNGEVHRDRTGAKIGMWLFLFTEVLLFGGLFLLYSVYRSQYPADFHFAASHLDITLGMVNTMVLLTSSLFMVLAVYELNRRNRRRSALFISTTIGMGLLFLVIKGVEWADKFSHGVYPNSAELLQRTPGENIFYSLYFAMTGLHGLHVLIGIIILCVMFVWVFRRPRKRIRISVTEPGPVSVFDLRGKAAWTHRPDESIEEIECSFIYREHDDVSEGHAILLENAGLYWHLVDVIWIFLFPLLYLIS